jgi:S-DNA-T family DNA segregation ATPase FtsK/SpoIIIE
MRWTAYNPPVMKRDAPVNDDGKMQLPEQGVLGIQHQSSAICALCEQLDLAGSGLAQLAKHRDEQVQEAQQRHEEVKKKQEERRGAGLEAIQTQSQDTLGKIDAKHRQRVSEIDKDRDRAVGIIQQQRRSEVSRVKQKCQEKIWLADTLLESETRKLDKHQKELIKALEERTKIILKFEEALGSSIGARLGKFLAIPEPISDEGLHDLSLEQIDEYIAQMSAAVDACAVNGIGAMLRSKAKKLELANDANTKLAHAKQSMQEFELQQGLLHNENMQQLNDQYKAEIAKTEHAIRAATAESDTKAGAAIKLETEKHSAAIAEREARRASEEGEVDQWIKDQTQSLETKYNEEVSKSQTQLETVLAESGSVYQSGYEQIESQLVRVVQSTKHILDHNTHVVAGSHHDWDAMPAAAQPSDVPYAIQLGKLQSTLRQRLDALPAELLERIALSDDIDTHAAMALPGPSSVVIRHDGDSRDAVLSVMRNLITRILATFPGRKARFVLTDPVGIGQSFAGYMRLSDLDPSPVGQRIWADPNQIERQLIDLTEHMQTVIQKYLRKDFATIEEYNKAAGEIAEPYRFVVIPDLDVALTEQGAARLKSILESGPRCGVYAILCTKNKAKLPSELGDSLESVPARFEIIQGGPKFELDTNAEISFTIDEEPTDQLLGQIMDRVAQASSDAGRIEVPFERLVPGDDDLWSRDCAEELVVPLGRSGARKVQELRLGLGTRQHALIAGRTGSGKSTLLHVMITAAGMWYGPDQLEMYLIDFKKGVEFKAYTAGRLPHVRAVAIESDREFGLSVLQRLDDELTTRGELFRKIGAQDLAGARKLAPDEHLPRVLLLIDEFQEFFTTDDEVASDASLLLDRLVRQGRAFGVHVILGSQTLSGAYSLARSTLGQIGVRVALQCSEADSYLILGEDNNAARLLERPGEAIYNNAGGLIEGNSPFQTAWLPDSDRDVALNRLPKPKIELPQTVVFEGNTLAKFDATRAACEQAYPDRSVPRVLLGESVAIAPPIAPMLSKRSGANLLVVGPQADSAAGMVASAALMFVSTPNARVIVIDSTPEEDSDFDQIRTALADAQHIEFHRTSDAVRVVSEVSELVTARAGHASEPVLFVVSGLHRLRELRKSEDFGFSLDDDAGSSPDRDLANILLEGPAAGVWTMSWCDTLTNLERTLDRGTIREFGLRALMQMSASDSTMLMDSSAASNLGANRAIFTDDVAGTEIKFRPVQITPSE